MDFDWPSTVFHRKSIFLTQKSPFFGKFVAEADTFLFLGFFAQAPFRRKESFAISTSMKKSLFESYSIDLTTIEPILICKQNNLFCSPTTQPLFLAHQKRPADLGLLIRTLKMKIRRLWFFIKPGIFDINCLKYGLSQSKTKKFALTDNN